MADDDVKAVTLSILRWFNAELAGRHRELDTGCAGKDSQHLPICLMEIEVDMVFSSGIVVLVDVDTELVAAILLLGGSVPLDVILTLVLRPDGDLDRF